MPHVAVKMYAGRTDEQKTRLAEAITKAFADALGSQPEAVSVAIEDVAPDDWMGKVYEPDIVGKRDNLFKRPGYGPLK